MDIGALLQCLRPHVTTTTHRRLSRITLALLMMTGRITMLGISRWAGTGGSYRTVQRLFSTVLPWALLFWVFFRQHVDCPADVYCVAGDEVIVTTAGPHTHGLDRFFSSLYGKPVPGLAFFTLSLVSVQKRRAFPMRIEQVVRSDAEKAASKAQAAAKKPKGAQATRRPGRPKGSKNTPTLRQRVAMGCPCTPRSQACRPVRSGARPRKSATRLVSRYCPPAIWRCGASSTLRHSPRCMGTRSGRAVWS